MIKQVGYDGIEIMADRPHMWPPDTDRARLELLKEKAASSNMVLCNINAFMMKAVGNIHHPSWVEPDEKDRNARLEHTKECLRLAHELGVPSISTEPGGPVEGMDRIEAIALFAEGIREALPLAESLGVKLLIEPEPDLLFEDLEETADFIEGFSSKALGINFDLGHFFCIGKDPAGLIRSWKGPIEHVHIEDIAEDRKHHHLIPGLGAMDFPAIFDALHARGYDGFVTVELYPYEDSPEDAARKAYEHLAPFVNP